MKKETCIEITLDENENLTGIEKIPEKTLIKVKIKDLLINTITSFYTKRKGKKINWYMKDRDKKFFSISTPILYTGRSFIKSKEDNIDKSTVNFLNTICDDFKDLRILIDKDMKKILIKEGYKCWVPIVSSDRRYRILKGHMQSRKTWAIISTSLYYLLKYRMSTFIIVQNSLDACEQMITRIRDVFISYITYIEKEKLKEEFKTLFKVLDCERGKTIRDEELEGGMIGSTPAIYISLRNSTDIGNVNNSIEKMKIKRYVVMIDESDFNDSGTDAAVQFELDKIKLYSSIVYDVTATPMTSLLKEDIEMGNVFVLSTPPGYKSILGVQCYDLQHEAEYCCETEDNPFLKDPNIADYIRDFSKTNPYKCRSFWGKQYHPRYSLVRIGSAITPQLKLADWTFKYYGNDILCITYNGSGYGVTIRGTKLPKESIIIGKIKSKYDKENCLHCFSKGLHIGNVIAYLQSEGVQKYPRIMVFAGTLADRGITFGTSEYSYCMQNKQYPWHLTEMYYIAAKSTTQSNLLQAAGRLCGVYPDNIPLSLYTNAGDEIYKSFGLQEELITRARNLNSENKLSKEIICEIPISKEKCSKRRVTAPRVSCVLNKTQDDFVFGGFDWKVEGYNYDGDEAKFGEGERIERTKVIVSDIEREKMRNDVEVKRSIVRIKYQNKELDEKEYNRLIKMLPRWARGTTKISMFLQNLDPKKEYSRNEILQDTENAGIRLSDCHLIEGQKRIKYGNIIQHTGKCYRMYPCLVEEFEKHFNVRSS